MSLVGVWPDPEKTSLYALLRHMSGAVMRRFRRHSEMTVFLLLNSRHYETAEPDLQKQTTRGGVADEPEAEEMGISSGTTTTQRALVPNACDSPPAETRCSVHHP